jgi:hypothetical protein
MSLPARQRRALGSIEGRLRAADPHLASMFAIFARLNAGEPVPLEPLALRLRRRWPRPKLGVSAVVLIPVMFIALVVVGALAGGPGRLPACEGAFPAGGSTPLVRPACQLTANTTAVKATTVATPDAAGNPACLGFALPRRSDRGWACYK